MMGFQTAPAQFFYDFCLDDHVPADHLLRRIDRFLDLESVRTALKPFYSSIGRPSVDPELMMRMLIVGYCMGLRSERRLCEEVHLNLAYRWFCRRGLEGKVPHHSTFARNRHGRFLQSHILRHTVDTCLPEAKAVQGQRRLLVDPAWRSPPLDCGPQARPPADVEMLRSRGEAVESWTLAIIKPVSFRP
jgi:transposase